MQTVAKSLIRVVIVCYALAAMACRAGRDRVPEIDLLDALPAAERRAADSVDEAVRMDVVGVEGDVRTALVMRAPARVTWDVKLPLHARLSTAIILVSGMPGTSGGVTVRIGLSDRRVYKEIGRAEATGAWVPVMLDLREYSEWKFSLFDQPLRKSWQLVLNADATPGGTVALAQPRLTRS